jgi:hypothetical protein
MNRMLVSTTSILHEYALTFRTTCRVKMSLDKAKEQGLLVNWIVWKTKSIDWCMTGRLLYHPKVNPLQVPRDPFLRLQPLGPLRHLLCKMLSLNSWTT